MSRPGDRLRALAARVCDAQTMERLIDPVVADLGGEPAEDLLTLVHNLLQDIRRSVSGQFLSEEPNACSAVENENLVSIRADFRARCVSAKAHVFDLGRWG